MNGEILFIAHRIPFPPDRGDKIRSWNIVKRLAQIAPVHIAAFADDVGDMVHAEALAEVAASSRIILRDRSRISAVLAGLCRGRALSVELFDYSEMRHHVARLLAERKIAAVFAYSSQAAQYVPELPSATRFIMDFVDVDSEKYAAYGQGQRGPMAWINRREGRMLRAFERQVAARADVNLLVSEAEAALFRDITGLNPAQVKALENGVDLEFFSPNAAFNSVDARLRGPGPLFVFTGQMDYRPNIEAVDSFARDSVVHIQKQFPEARFVIVGRNPTAAVKALASLPGVQVTGAISDVRGWLSAADIVVAPLRLARGVQNKVLEAMAMGKPVIASSQAAEGIAAVPGIHLLVADGCSEEVAAATRLLSDKQSAMQMGRAARRHMEERYSWDATLAQLPFFVSGAQQRVSKAAQVA